MGQTKIEWTQFSVNPIRARLRDAAHAALATGGYGSGVGHYCEKISPGCANCYASSSQPRFGMPEFPGSKKRLQNGPPELPDGGPVVVREDVEVFLDDAKLQEVLRRRTPTTWFWCDQTDLFGAWVPDEWIDRCFATMALTPQHTHQVLTKRPERMAAYLLEKQSPLDSDNGRRDMIAEVAAHLGKIVWDPRGSDVQNYYGIAGGTRGKDFSNRRAFPGWPLPNVWLGVSVEDQAAADERIPHLLRCPAAVRFLSAEPLLGAIELAPWIGLECRHAGAYSEPDTNATVCAECERTPTVDWVIVGGESGAHARPCYTNWIDSIVEQCSAAGVAVFVKQLGGNHRCVDDEFGDVPIPLKDKKGGDIAEFPESLRVRGFPNVKEAARDGICGT